MSGRRTTVAKSLDIHRNEGSAKISGKLVGNDQQMGRNPMTLTIKTRRREDQPSQKARCIRCWVSTNRWTVSDGLRLSQEDREQCRDTEKARLSNPKRGRLRAHPCRHPSWMGRNRAESSRIIFRTSISVCKDRLKYALESWG